MLRNNAVKLGPEEIFSSYIFMGIINSTGGINGEDCDRMWVGVNSELTDPRRVC